VNTALSKNKNGKVLALGNFDGIHLGHRALMAEVFKRKTLLGACGEILTFSPHPLVYLAGAAPPLLMEEDEKLIFFRDYMGIDKVNTWEFNAALSATSAADFLKSIHAVFDDLRHVVVGFNYSFGKGGQGKATFVKHYCDAENIGCTIIPAVYLNKQIISSSCIREQIAAGNMDYANKMLGYWYNISGRVEKGNQIGRVIGFNTANISLNVRRQLPPNGVYAARAAIEGKCCDAIVNIGLRPTLGGKNKDTILEAHLLADNIPSLYGKTLRVYLAKFMRPEKTFADLSCLRAEIAENIKAVKCYLKKIPFDEHLPKAIK
jgi:riboflavin kinase/FMN adenylyltransferase